MTLYRLGPCQMPPECSIYPNSKKIPRSRWWLLAASNTRAVRNGVINWNGKKKKNPARRTNDLFVFRFPSRPFFNYKGILYYTQHKHKTLPLKVYTHYNMGVLPVKRGEDKQFYQIARFYFEFHGSKFSPAESY